MSCDCEIPLQETKKTYSWEQETTTMCHPGVKPIIPSSCLSKGALVRIIEAWNEEHPKKKLKRPEQLSADTLYKKVETMMKQQYGCKDEVCWVQSLKSTGMRDTLLSLFKPEYPMDFKQNPKAWWSSSQIDRVIRPYVYSHPFYWGGVVPLDFKEQRAMKMCLSREICSVNIGELLRSGCCLIGVIFNLDYSGQSGSHWVLGIVDMRRGYVGFMDSYGYKPLKLIQDWMTNCVDSINQLCLQHTWCNCEEYTLTLRPNELKWSTNGTTASIKASIPHHLKIDDGMVATSSVSGRKVQILKSTKQKHIVLAEPISEEEQQGEFTVIGARTYILSRPVQKSATECGSYCIHVLLEALAGKSWYTIMKELPKDKKVAELRKTLHRLSD